MNKILAGNYIKSLKNLRQKLDYHYEAFDKTKLEPDPLQFLHLFKDEKDIEIMGFLASVFAYGNVKQINSTLRKILLLSDNHPYDFIKNYSAKRNRINFKHRFYTSQDIHHLFLLISLSVKKFVSLKNLFLKGYDEKHVNVKESISEFSNYFLQSHKERFSTIPLGIRFMFPLPEKGSACKRMNLFLRWMVRKDELDFGFWSTIPTSKLIIPVDTHIARICKELKLTHKKNVSWQMAEEITENLKSFDRDDPVKYDFALCHIGMRKLHF